ncbi:MAG: hypothetical protein JWO38_7661 [Gemmataceae bacterium]|nr:hypothetical protein [Gemmataceae bacterium]
MLTADEEVGIHFTDYSPTGPILRLIHTETGDGFHAPGMKWDEAWVIPGLVRRLFNFEYHLAG